MKQGSGSDLGATGEEGADGGSNASPMASNPMARKVPLLLLEYSFTY
jgi:hypothetical protein